ncbi:MAG: hydrogenase maturation peptidase HycI, partial [Bacillota bacterium]|nr:hydrogenase maturation peptidase HycI [Bacillota bacterium]
VPRIFSMLNSLTSKIKQCLKLHKGLNIIVSLGNSCRKDDGVGPFIASQLEPADNLIIIDAGITPENIAEKIIGCNPSYLVFIDAANFNGKPGEVRLIAKSEISEHMLSTHAFPLKIISEIIESETNAQIRFIGIQPRDTGFGEGLSREVRRAANKIIRMIKRQL